MTAVPYSPGSDGKDQAEEIYRHGSISEPSKAASHRHNSNHPAPPHSPKPTLLRIDSRGHRKKRMSFDLT